MPFTEQEKLEARKAVDALDPTKVKEALSDYQAPKPEEQNPEVKETEKKPVELTKNEGETDEAFAARKAEAEKPVVYGGKFDKVEDFKADFLRAAKEKGMSERAANALWAQSETAKDFKDVEAEYADLTKQPEGQPAPEVTTEPEPTEEEIRAGVEKFYQETTLDRFNSHPTIQLMREKGLIGDQLPLSKEALAKFRSEVSAGEYIAFTDAFKQCEQATRQEMQEVDATAKERGTTLAKIKTDASKTIKDIYKKYGQPIEDKQVNEMVDSALRADWVYTLKNGIPVPNEQAVSAYLWKNALSPETMDKIVARERAEGRKETGKILKDNRDKNIVSASTSGQRSGGRVSFDPKDRSHIESLSPEETQKMLREEHSYVPPRV